MVAPPGLRFERRIVPFRMSTSSVSSPAVATLSAASLALVGRTFFGISLLAFGIQQLIWQNFVRIVPALPAWLPYHSVWAVTFGLILIVAGLSIIAQIKARLAALIVAALILTFVIFLDIPEIAIDPTQGFRWTNPAKALALFGGALLVASLSRMAIAERATVLTRIANRLLPYTPRLLLSVFLVICGVQHFVYADFVVTLIPAFIPAHLFWTYFAAVALIAGGVGVLFDFSLRWAAILTGIMIFCWVFLLHLPRALSDLHQAGEMAGVFEALALSGVAFMLALPPSRINSSA
jgi:uncharacterized membrane protein YphA (DoxX/SURF4 family)